MILFCCFTILFLFFLSIEDLKSRRVRLLPALIFAGGMFLSHIILKDLPLKELLWGSLLGAGLLVISLITHSAIGGGDALAVLSCASALGGSAEFAALLLFFPSFFCSAEKSPARIHFPFFLSCSRGI